jgi:hypothetical protein
LTAADFAKNLKQKFSSIADFELKEIGQFVGSLNEQSIEALWNEFRDTYTLTKYPLRAHFVTLAKTMGITQGSAYRQDYEMICWHTNPETGHQCSQTFPLSYLNCPACGFAVSMRECSSRRRRE